MRRLLLTCGLAFAFVQPATVLAQDPYGSPTTEAPAQSAPDSRGGRDGLVIGFDMFAGSGLDSDTHGAAGMGVRIGWMLSPTLALMLDTQQAH